MKTDKYYTIFSFSLLAATLTTMAWGVHQCHSFDAHMDLENIYHDAMREGEQMRQDAARNAENERIQREWVRDLRDYECDNKWPDKD